MQITLTPKDLEKHKIAFSGTGSLIDELAYSIDQWTSEDLYENNFEYEPQTPYDFNYEADLFQATKTEKQFLALWQDLMDEPINVIFSTDLQAGAYMAFNYPSQWQELLTDYTEKLQENYTNGISEAYNTELQKEIDSYHKYQYKEWLDGDHRDWNGIVYEMAKYYTESREGSYDGKTDSYTFTLNDEDIENWKDKGYNKNQIKTGLLAEILASAKSRKAKDEAKREANRAERERLTAYKAEQTKQAEEKRKEKLLSMKLA